MQTVTQEPGRSLREGCSDILTSVYQSAVLDFLKFSHNFNQWSGIEQR